MKKLLSTFITTLLFIIVGCNNADKHTDHDQSLGDDGSNNGTASKIQLTWNKDQVNTGDSVRFTFTPRWQPGNTIATLEKVHEKKIHFIIVSNDLSYFDHLHLDEDSAGIYHITTAFPFGGKYLLIADYKAKGLTQQADTFSININGKVNIPVTYNSEQLSATTNGYAVQLAHKKLETGKQAMLIMKLSKGGQAILPDSLQPYLGEVAHMIAINTVTKEYVHMHSMSDPMSFWFMATFKNPGFYKLWIQFKKGNVVNTVPMVIKVD